MAKNYIINFVDITKTPLTIVPALVNGPSGSARSTDLNLTGVGTTLWGEHILGNMINHLENFACAEESPNVPDSSLVHAPKTPIEGQLWYNKTQQDLFVYVVSGSPEVGNWSTIGGASSGNYVLLNGTSTLTGNLDLGSHKIINLGTATEETDALNMVTADGRYVRLTGAESIDGVKTFSSTPIMSDGVKLSGALIMGTNIISGVADPTEDDHAFSRLYADTRYLQSGAGSFSVSTSTSLTLKHLSFFTFSTINFNTNRLINVGTAENGTDALNWATADARYLKKTAPDSTAYGLSCGSLSCGSLSCGDITISNSSRVLDMNGSRLRAVGTPSHNDDAIPRIYADGRYLTPSSLVTNTNNWTVDQILNDNIKLSFGNGSDLSIYSNGTVSNIKNNLGSLVIDNDASNGFGYLKSDKGGVTTTALEWGLLDGTLHNVLLRCNGTERLKTTGSGITVTGTGTGTDWTATSDIQLKDNFLVVDNALEKIMKISGYTFTRNNDDTDTRYAGVIAQEVQKVLPEVVSKGTDDMLSVSYGSLNALLIESIKELNVKVNNLQCEVDKYKN